MGIEMMHTLFHSFQIIGHSLGGSLAEMAALYSAKRHYWPAQSIRLMTFGQPRTGDVRFAEAIEHYLPYHFRIVHKNDIITSLPWKMLAHSNGRIQTTSPYHHRYEVWYDNDMSTGSEYQVCMHECLYRHSARSDMSTRRRSNM